MDNSLLVLIEKQYHSDLKEIKENVNRWKSKSTLKNENFSSMISYIIEGLNLNIYTKELNDLICEFEYDVKWLLCGIKLIKNFTRNYQSETMENNPILLEIHECFNHKKIFDLDFANNTFSTLLKIINNFETSDRLKSSKEYLKLKELYKEAQKWNEEAKMVIIFFSLSYFLKDINSA